LANFWGCHKWQLSELLKLATLSSADFLQLLNLPKPATIKSTSNATKFKNPLILPWVIKICIQRTYITKTATAKKYLAILCYHINTPGNHIPFTGSLGKF